MENIKSRCHKQTWSIIVAVWPQMSFVHKLKILVLAYTSVGKRERAFLIGAVLIVAGLAIYISSGSWAWAFLIGAIVGIAMYVLLKQ